MAGRPTNIWHQTTDFLQLKARDKADLEVISACLQDALTRLGDMHYDARRRRLALIFTRYRWEDDDRTAGEDVVGQDNGQRIRCGMHFDDLLSLQVQGIDQNDRQGLLPLLAMTAEERAEGYDITLLFAGGGSIRLGVECISAALRDLGPPWPAAARPDHDVSDKT